SLRYTANGIYTEESDNATLIGNEIAKCVSRGIYLTSSLYPTIVDNSIESVGSNGIDVSGANNASISANSIQDSGTYGIQLLASSYGVVHGNAISDATTAAMYISGVLESEFTDNTMVNCGFLFEVGSLPNFIHLIDGNTVNGLPVYYEPGLNSQDILASNYGQILLVNNSWITVHDGVLDHASIPIEMAYSSNCDFANVDTSYSYIGVAALYSENMTFQGLTHIGDGVSSGMVVFYSSNVSVENSEFLRARSTVFSAITTSGTSDVTISESLFDGNFGAIRITGGSDILISDNHILNTAVNSVYMDSVSDYIRIINNEIHNSTYGIRGSSSYNWTIMDNTVMYCSQSGIYITGESSDYVNITLNSISNNADGIRVYEGDDASITNNTIMWNSGIGIELISSLSTEVFYNLIALNFGGNGDDSAAGNYWDDGSTLGNAWDDFTPPAPYQVDTNTQDRYPIQFLPTEPIINQPQDIYYAEGSEGNEITWYAFDDSLKDWSVTIDGDDWASDAWDFNDITVNIDGLLYGTHTVEVTLYDVDQNSVSDTVLVHVYDGTSPSINNVPNTWSFVSGSGQTLTWQVYDLHPDTYIVHVDDEEFDTDTWTSGELEVNIDGLTEGLHTLLIEIYDIDGNVAFDQVEILVIDDTIDPTVDSPSDITYTLGETGNSIVWNAEDQYPLRFEVAYNGSTMVEGSWGGSRIAISVDGLSVGSHVFTITVEDGGGNTATDSVTVSVLPIQEQVTPPPPIDLGVLLIVLGVVGAAIVVVAVVFFLKKRR
ncbi:MAG: right-handed parallel beta-helix repeat-containing protein, partial [Candidatus Thorarchaeota archaeon]